MAEGVEIASAYIALYTKMPGVGRDIDSVLGGSEVSGAVKKAGERSGGLFSDAFGKYLSAAAITAGVVAAFKGFYEVGAVFDDVSDTIRIGTGATGEALAALEQVAQNVATSIPTSFAAAGSTVADLNTRLGLTGETLTTVSAQFLEAGRLMGEPIDVSTTTGLFNAFRIEGDAVSGALDHLFQVSQSTGVSMNELASKSATAAPLVKNLGLSFEETSALIGVFDKAGEPIDKVIASLNAGLVNLAKSGEPLDEAFRRTVSEIQAFVASGNEAAAFDLAGKVFGTRGASAFVASIQSGSLALDDLVGAAGLSGDTILGVAAETNDFAESWAILKNQVVSALEPLGSAVFGQLSKGITSLTGLMEEFGPAISASFGTLGETLGPLFAGLAPTLKQLIPPLLQLWQSLSPVSLVFKTLEPLIPQIVEVLSTLAGVVTQLVGQALAALAPVVEALVTHMSGLLGAVLPLIAPVLELVAAFLPLLTPLLDLVGTVLPPLIDLFSFLVGLVLEPLIGVLKVLIPVITAVVGILVNSLAPVITMISDYLGGLIDFLVGVFTGDWERAWNGIVQMFKGVWNGIVGIVESAVNGIIDLINLVLKGVNEVGGGVGIKVGLIPRVSFGAVKLAEGAIVSHTPGGRAAIVGEGRYDEVVQPLGGPQFERLASALAEKMGRSGPLVGQIVNPDPYTVVELLEQRVGSRLVSL